MFLAGVVKFIKQQFLYYSDEFIVCEIEVKLPKCLRAAPHDLLELFQCSGQASPITSLLKSDTGYYTSLLLQKRSKYYV